MPDSPIAAGPASTELLDTVHRTSFDYFLREANARNGLVIDSTHPDSPASIAATGFLLASLPAAVERGWMDRGAARTVALAAVRFFRDAPQDGARDGVGFRGFFYHFLDMAEGRRAWKSELSTIDTTLLVAGLLCAAEYFDADTPDERELRDGARAVYERVEWDWALNPEPGSGDLVSMGWTPERGFLRYRWQGYNEALLLQALAAGSPTHAIPAASFEAYTRTYRWKTIYGYAHVYAGPLFIHQFSHLWIDFRDIPDAYMRAKGIDYFENSRRATLVQREYARRNPRGFDGYSADTWGLTASDGPGPAVLDAGGRRQRFWGYRARGVPFGPDDGTLAPWAAIASLPFAPDAVLECLHSLANLHDGTGGPFGFENSYNPTVPRRWARPSAGCRITTTRSTRARSCSRSRTTARASSGRLMRRCGPLADGLRRIGFAGGWLGEGDAEGG